MPLFMDVHDLVEGLTADVFARAHHADLEIQAKYNVKYLRYWFNEEMGRAFCLVEAPSRQAAEAVHREAHGLIADIVIKLRDDG